MKASAVHLSAANFSINFMGFAADICSAHGGNQTGKAALIKLRQVYNLEHGVILIKISKKPTYQRKLVSSLGEISVSLFDAPTLSFLIAAWREYKG